MNHKQAAEILTKGGMVRLPEWPRHEAIRGWVKPRRVRALLTSTDVPYIAEAGPWPQLHEDGEIVKRTDFEPVLEDALKKHAVR